MFHTIIIAGYLGRDPEMRYLPDGRPVTNFSVAASRKWTGQDGQPQEETVWFRISVFGRQAETCNQYLTKGRPVLVEGRLRPGEGGNPTVFQRQDGTWGASFEVVAQTVRFLSGRGDAAAPGAPVEAQAAAPGAWDAPPEEEIPF